MKTNVISFQILSWWWAGLSILMAVGCAPQKRHTAQAANHYPLDSIRKELLDSEGQQILVVAHRGDWRNAPENSIQAIKNCIAIGVDVVEVDVKKTKDGRLVLMHDKTLGRTTTGSGLVSEWTLADLKTLQLKNGTGRPTHHRIPTLEEAMQTAKGKVMVNLDHCYDYFPEAYEVLKKTNTVDHAIMKGYRKTVEQVQDELADYLGEVIFMPIINLEDSAASAHIRAYQAQMNPAAYEFVFQSDTSSLIGSFDELKSKGSRVWVNALWASLNGGHDDDRAVYDLPGSYEWIVRRGANLIQTDRPELLLEYLRKKGLHR